jgi:hypothetical protein
MILHPPYRYERETDLIPNRTVFRIFDATGDNVAVCWTEFNAVGMVAALDAADLMTRLRIENAELKEQLARLLLS